MRGPVIVTGQSADKATEQGRTILVFSKKGFCQADSGRAALSVLLPKGNLKLVLIPQRMNKLVILRR